MKNLAAALLLFISVSGFAAEQNTSATVSVQNLPGSVAAGFHIALKGRKICEKKLNAPGFADLSAYILQQNYRKMQNQFDKLGCELQFYDYPFLPFDDYYTRDEMSFIRGRVPNEKVADALRLVSQLIRNAQNINEKELAEAVRSCTRSNRMRASLGNTAGTRLREILFPGEYPALPTYFSGKTPSITKVKQFMELYDTPENMVITVVGKVNPAALREKILKEFSGWGGTACCRNIYSPEILLHNGKTVTIETRRKSRGYILLALPLKDKMQTDELAAALLFARQLSDTVSFQLREREGLAYSVGAGIRNIAGHYFLVLSMGTSPKHVRYSAKRMDEMLGAALQKRKISKSDLDRIRNSLLISRRMKRLTNVNKAFFIGVNILWHRPLNFEEQLDNSIKKADIDFLANVKALLNGPEIRILINATEGQVGKTAADKGTHRKHP
ncbi:MAG: insulinase family protein [Acidobacteria bacterium]|nr:insulinase family protein [Acidobacteriota bacterium]